MGFLKYSIKIFLFLWTLILLSGCAKSIIKIVGQSEETPVVMFAETGERNFYYPVDFSDSLNLLWENDAHGSFNNSSFIFFDSTVFTHDLGGRIHAFNIHTGKLLGVLKFKGAVLSTPVLFSSVIVTALVLNNENKTKLIFYDFFKGKELKTIEVNGKIINQMLRIENDLFLITENGMAAKYSSRGNEIWKRNLDSFVHSDPAYSNGKIYFGNDSGELVCIDSESSNIIYKKKIGGVFNGGVTIKENFAFLGDDYGVLYAFNLKKGELEWNFNSGSRIIMNPAVDYENIIFGNLSGKLFSLKKENGKKNWEIKNNGAVFSSTPILTNNRIIISNLFKSVLIVDKLTGNLVKEISLDARVKMTPAIRNNLLFIGYDNGIVRAYEIIN